MTSYGNKPECCSPPIPAYQHNRNNLFILLTCQLTSSNDQVLISSKVLLLQWLHISDYLLAEQYLKMMYGAEEELQSFGNQILAVLNIFSSCKLFLGAEKSLHACCKDSCCIFLLLSQAVLTRLIQGHLICS